MAHYAVYHDGHAVGLTSEAFGAAARPGAGIAAAGPRGRSGSAVCTSNSSTPWPATVRLARPTAWALRVVAAGQGLRARGAPLR